MVLPEPHKLIPHPAFPPAGVTAIEVAASFTDGRATLVYRVRGGPPVIPPPAPPVRTEDLWKRTCFELFVRGGEGEGYCEFNFSPSRAWAAWQFEGYRTGRSDLPLAAPGIEPVEDGVRVTLDLPAGGRRVGLNAVIEEAGGVMSYWALAHGADRPDFHHPANFELAV